MLVVQLHVVHGPVVLVDQVAADHVPARVHDPHLRLGSDDHVVLDEVHPGYLLAVHVEAKQLLLLLDAEAEDAAFNVPEGQNVLVAVDGQRGDLVLVVVEVLLVVEHVAHVPEHLDGAVPGGGDDGLALGHVDDVDDGVVVRGEGLGLAAVDDVEDVDVVVPGSDLDRGGSTAKTSSDLSITMALRLNSQILKDLVQFFS